MKIFCFVNSGAGTDMQGVLAMCEDGNVLANHLSSHEQWAKHDIGMTNDMGMPSDWKHDAYDKHCGAGNWELEWVDAGDVMTHSGLQAAYKLNQLLAAKAAAKE